MNIKLKTEELKDAINKIVKGLGNNKMLPITEMIGINADKSTLSLVSTDGTNKVQVVIPIEGDNEPTSFVVNGKTFSQLVLKTTTEFINLSIEDGKLVVKGNGSYSFSFPTDEDGEFIVIPNVEVDKDTKVELSAEDLKNSYNINKSSVSVTMETPAYTGFYYDDNGSVATNSLKISYVNKKLFSNPILLNAKLASLFSILPEEKVNVYQGNSEIAFESGNVTIQGFKMDDVSEFPINDIIPFLTADLPHKVRLNKKALLNLLERIAVFVTPFDKNSIKIDFTKNGVRVWTLDGINNEIIPYTDSENVEETSIKVDVTNFKDLVGSNPEEELVIMYGHPAAIKMTFGNVSQVLALVGE